jgi:acetyl-CoA acyltransferase
MKNNAYIISSIRTPVGKANGVFKNTRPDDLLSFILKEIIKDNPSIDTKKIDDVIIGCAMPEGEQGLNIARTASLLAGYPNSISGVTINRFCASGLQSIAYAADRIRLGEADIMIAGGVESMSMIPVMGHHPAFNIKILNKDNRGISYSMGITAEQVAMKYQIDRELQDEFAFNSHQKAITATNENLFRSEIRPYLINKQEYNQNENKIKYDKQIITDDEGIRYDTSMEKLASLKSVFQDGGTVTAGNSSQMSDGASATILCSEKMLHDFDLTPMARFVGYAVSGVDPKIMGMGPVVAVPKVLKQCGIGLDEIEHIELNEAFASQSLAVIKELNLNPEIVNPLGGAIALGHPLGATGSIRTTTLLNHLIRTGKRYGMVTMCIGGGMGAAAIFENI